MLICSLELETNCLAGTMDVSYTLCNEARVVSIFILSLSSSCYYYHDYSLFVWLRLSSISVQVMHLSQRCH